MIPFAENFRLNSLRYSCESIHLQEKVMNLSKSNSNVYLWVYKDNIKAFNLYNKIGFNIKEETDSRYYMEYKVVENRK